MFRTLAWKLAKPLGIRWLLARIDDAANGQLGPRWRAAYWGLAGAKTWIGLFFGVTALLLAVAGSGAPAHAAAALAAVAGIAVSAGLLDKAWRAPHVPAVLAQSSLYRFLAENSAGLTTALVAAFAWVQSSACHDLVIAGVTITCVTLTTVLLVLAGLCAYLGLLDASFAARAPLPPAVRDVFRNYPPPPPGVAVVVVLLALSASACGSAAQLQLGRGASSHPDERVVKSYVCAGDEDAARLYLSAPAFAWLGPALERYLTDARDAKRSGACPCPAPGCPGH